MDKVVVNEKTCLDSFTPDVFATDAVLNLVNEGIPFRDAYIKIAGQLDQLKTSDPLKNILAKTHIGATGNLGLDIAKERISQLQVFVNAKV